MSDLSNGSKCSSERSREFFMFDNPATCSSRDSENEGAFPLVSFSSLSRRNRKAQANLAETSNHTNYSSSKIGDFVVHRAGEAKADESVLTTGNGGSGNAFLNSHSKCSVQLLAEKTERRRIEDFYSLGPKLGEGATGVVRLAECLETRVLYACKTIRISRKIKSKLRDAARAEVKKEIRAMEKVRGHANVAELRESFEDEHRGTVHLIMDLCTGGDLFDYLIDNRTAVEEDDIAHIFWQAASALAYCHAKGVVHRDVKPENLLVATKVKAANGKKVPLLKLADFGLALVLSPEQRIMDMAGSAAYMAPEICKGEAYGAEADMWSLGVSLYCALSGFFPFNGRNDEDTMACIVNKKPDFRLKPWPTVSLDAKILCKSLLCADPSERLTAQRFLEHKWIVKHIPRLESTCLSPPLSPYFLNTLARNTSLESSTKGSPVASPAQSATFLPRPVGSTSCCNHCNHCGSFTRSEGFPTSGSAPGEATSPTPRTPFRQEQTMIPRKAASYWRGELYDGRKDGVARRSLDILPKPRPSSRIKNPMTSPWDVKSTLGTSRNSMESCNSPRFDQPGSFEQHNFAVPPLSSAQPPFHYPHDLYSVESSAASEDSLASKPSCMSASSSFEDMVPIATPIVMGFDVPFAEEREVNTAQSGEKSLQAKCATEPAESQVQSPLSNARSFAFR
eukprot:TRINITY_DN20974_c0_g1_i1.p1 TRINITY_DN20974_c0_g1~~TRINITY_DN20974_c0_g1_i1.p1  ORF type:complete len:679 (+),score=70.58 TRINITY_DN20974_c0_g1_i1:856-2892(+)